MFGLCDCNNFFVSCERVFNPSLNGLPVVVLSNNDGCIIARSEEAKVLGIKMGQPLYQVKDLIEKKSVKLFSSNYQLYGDMSQRVMDTLKQMVPWIEVYSIDEAFLHFDKFETSDLQSYGKDMVRTIKRHTGIPVSLGIAPTKTLAKVASKLCKRYPRLENCCLMDRPQDIAKVLCSFPVGDVWGIGYRSVKMLNSYGIFTAEQFRMQSLEWVQSKMGIVGLRTWKELHGEPCIEFEHDVSDKKSIMVSRSFSREILDLPTIQSAVTTFVSMAAEKLRKQSSLTMQMLVFIRTNRHREDLPQHKESFLVTFPVATNSTLEMVQQAMIGLKTIIRSGYGYKRAGVILTNIVPDCGIQSVLFDEIDRTKHSALMKTIDQINAKQGRNTISLGNQIGNPIPTNREHLSPQYTTEWNDILVVKV